MCQSKEIGGKRCELADQLANERHKVRSRMRGKSNYDIDKEVKKAEAAYLRSHTELVMAHLPETQPFQTPPSSKVIPQKYRDMLKSRRATITSTATPEEHAALITRLYEEHEKLEEKLTEDEKDALHWYTMNGYEFANTYLRRKGYTKNFKGTGSGFLHTTAEGGTPITLTPKQYGESKIKPRIDAMDSALLKAEQMNEVRKLYRFIELPEGVDDKEYVNKYFHEGQDYKDKGFMSTTADPDFILGHTQSGYGDRKKKKYLILEILTARGSSLQHNEKATAGDIQSLEAEVLLPRGARFRIASKPTRRSIKLLHNRMDLANQFHSTYDRYGKNREGAKGTYQVVQLVDEKLLEKPK